MKSQTKKMKYIIKNILLIILIILLLVSSISLFLLNFNSLGFKKIPDKSIEEKPRITFNGHPINNSEAQRLGTISLKELMKLYP